MNRVIIQTGQGIKAHDRHFQSMRSAWSLRPAPFVRARMGHARWRRARQQQHVRQGCTEGAPAGEWIQHTLLTKRTHPWRIRTQRSCYSRLLREANSRCADSSRCRSQGCGLYATRWSWPKNMQQPCPRRTRGSTSILAVRGNIPPETAGVGRRPKQRP